VKHQFFVELAFDAPWMQQRAQTEEKIAQVHGRYASFITRSIAADMRAHSLASTAS
jgi:hypothetical protein